MIYLSETFWDIPELFVHFYQIITNFLCVCQSISWIPYLLKLGQYGDISCSRWDVFHKFLGDIPWMFLHYFQINTNYLYAVSLLVDLLPYWNKTNIGIYPVPGEISFCIFWRHSWDVVTPFPNNSKFLVCLSVC